MGGGEEGKKGKGGKKGRKGKAAEKGGKAGGRARKEDDGGSGGEEGGGSEAGADGEGRAGSAEPGEEADVDALFDDTSEEGGDEVRCGRGRGEEVRYEMQVWEGDGVDHARVAMAQETRRVWSASELPAPPLACCWVWTTAWPCSCVPYSALIQHGS